MTKYMHTLGGRPAYFDGNQIVYPLRYGKAVPLASSLKQIRSEQAKTKIWREKKGYAFNLFDYGYVRINTN